MSTCVKCVVVGDCAAGKTSLLMSYLGTAHSIDNIPYKLEPTNVDKTVDDNHFQLLLWDTAFEEYDRWQALCYGQTDVFLICFSIQSEDTYVNIKERWYPEVTHHVPDAPVLIIGCKQDLRIDANKLVSGFVKDWSLKQMNIPMEIMSIIRRYYNYRLNDAYAFNQLLTEDDGLAICKEVGAHKYMECSAFHSTGVDAIFEEVCRCHLINLAKKGKSSKCKGCLIL